MAQKNGWKSRDKRVLVLGSAGFFFTGKRFTLGQLSTTLSLSPQRQATGVIFDLFARTSAAPLFREERFFAEGY